MYVRIYIDVKESNNRPRRHVKKGCTDGRHRKILSGKRSFDISRAKSAYLENFLSIVICGCT